MKRYLRYPVPCSALLWVSLNLLMSGSATSDEKSPKWWCAKQSGVSYESRETCETYGGLIFALQSLAILEHKRLQKGSSTSSSDDVVYCATASGFYWSTSSQCAMKGGEPHQSREGAKSAHERQKVEKKDTTNGSNYLTWCAQPWGVSNQARSACIATGGEAYQYEFHAQTAHKRLKAASTSATSDKPQKAPSSNDTGVWCATKHSVRWTDENHCSEGNGYSSRHQAETEHKRLKTKASPIFSDPESGWLLKVAPVLIAIIFAALLLVELGKHRTVKRKRQTVSTPSPTSPPPVKVTPKAEPQAKSDPEGRLTSIKASSNKKFTGQRTVCLDDGSTYSGEWWNDRFQGQGIMTWPDGRKYVGEWKDNKLHGQGTFVWPLGEKYVGEFEDGKKHGQGAMIDKDGAKYEGEWRFNERWKGAEYDKNGNLTATYSDGQYYEEDKPTDQRVSASDDSPTDSDEQREDKYHGQDTSTSTDEKEEDDDWESDESQARRDGAPAKVSVVRIPEGDRYSGESKDKKPHGEGTYTCANGDTYVGEFQNGKLNGQGTFTGPQGNKYVGEWKDGKNHGQGTHTWPDGQEYVGEWKEDKRHGQGTNTFPSGAKYVGEWKEGKRNGQGTHTWPDGQEYVGEWKEDKRHGQGTNTFPSGEKYVGEYEEGQKHGQGTFTWPNGNKYVGKWRENKRHGQGTLTLADGGTYTGEWKDDVAPTIAPKYDKPRGSENSTSTAGGRDEKKDNFTGRRTVTYDDGSTYSGEFKDGKRHGQGTMTDKEGTKSEGDWKYNNLSDGTEYDKDGNVTATYSDGFWNPE